MTASKPAVSLPAGLSELRAGDLETLRSGLRIITLRALGDPDAADDAVQETLSRAVVALAEGRLEDPSKLGAYVAGIARHVCAHVLRDRKDIVPLPQGSGDTVTHPQLQTDADPLDALISAAELSRLEAALAELSPSDQHVLRLCFHEARSPAEVAKALAEPPGRVRKRKSRALERLRRAFLGQGGRNDD